MLHSRTAALALAGALGLSSVQAAPVILVADASGTYYTVDAADGSISVKGSSPIAQAMEDIALSPTGDLYGISQDRLYRINTNPGHYGELTAIGGTLGTTGANGWFAASLVFGTDGTLYAASDALFTINTTTGSATRIGNGGYTYGASTTWTGDLAFVSGRLLLSSGRIDTGALVASEDLVELNPGTGVGSLVGQIGSFDYNTSSGSGFLTVWGLASPNGIDLYGVAGKHLLSINPTTAAASLVQDYSTHSTLLGANGAAVLPVAAVPLPASLWLCAPALGLLLGRRRHPPRDAAESARR
jgi:hypothetical protein